ncbi:MAG TPA: response regulator transcription factor [Pilimelia sp.]|nr:response regulator transcription factor [Pilimelia sp.]
MTGPGDRVAEPGNRLRVMLANDHTLFRAGIAGLLAVEPDLEVVAQAGDSETAVRLAAATRPSVVLLDDELPYDPVQVTIGRLQRAAPGTRILVLTARHEPFLAQEVLAAEAHGVLAKDATREELVSAVRAVAYHGKTVLLPSRPLGEPPHPAQSPLSPREREVLELAGQALSNAQIGAQLYITEGTVKRHLTNIYAKLGAVSRLDAVNKAVAARMIRPPEPGVTRPPVHRRGRR